MHNEFYQYHELSTLLQIQETTRPNPKIKKKKNMVCPKIWSVNLINQTIHSLHLTCQPPQATPHFHPGRLKLLSRNVLSHCF